MVKTPTFISFMVSQKLYPIKPPVSHDIPIRSALEISSNPMRPRGHRQKARGRPGVGHEELQWSGFGAALGKLTIASCSWGSSHVTGDYWKAYWK